MMTGCNGFRPSSSEVVPQVPAVRHIDRIRCSGTGRFAVSAGAVAANHLGSGMCSQPFVDGAGRALGENINWTVSIHVDQHRAVPVSPRSAKSSIPSTRTVVVDESGDARTRLQLGRVSYENSQHRCQPRSGSSGHCECDLLEDFAQQRSSSRVGSGQSVDLLDK